VSLVTPSRETVYVNVVNEIGVEPSTPRGIITIGAVRAWSRLRSCLFSGQSGVPMNERSRPTLRKLVSEAKSQDRHFLFVSPTTGQRLNSIEAAWRNACEAVGIRDLRVHDLRHTFGTRAADGGAPLPAIKDVMSHKSVKTTERYTHATHEAKRRTMEIAGRKVEKSGHKSWPADSVYLDITSKLLKTNSEGGTRTRTAFLRPKTGQCARVQWTATY
jgi:hypothetical protein